ncbi:ATP synthase subunit delta [Aliidongia dinghuensis]|uniref:ATP synthase subunit delta n=1 Tax=Aliidongia dinghuensis TaxID=1867774 RepID=A0A8J2YRV2_9PROT|nr:F0F1 ATP synthase subunit delta [Aliidongia dinghuensis]GGF07595.1 ATP synthase subunit delta [Aliidongia dinghuensis]
MASEATGVSGLAGRYATALFDLADQQQALDAIEGDLVKLRQMIEESPDLERLIRSPVLSREQQARAMAALMEKAAFGQIVRNFVGVVAQNRRLFALTDIIRGYLALVAERRGEVTAQVTAAQALTEGQLAAINEQINRAIGSKVAVDVRVDPAIIGGLVVKVGSRMVDGSLRTKLTRLQLAMRGI